MAQRKETKKMSILITFIKLLAVFDLLVIAVYFGSDILSTVWSKFRKKPTREEPFDFSLDAAAVPLSIDSNLISLENRELISPYSKI